MNFLILSGTNSENERFISYHKHLCDGLVAAGHSAKVILKRPPYFFRVLSMARRADIIFAHNFPSVVSAALFASKFFKKKLIVKLSSDYVWETAINKGKTFLLINDFQKTKKNGTIARLHRLQANLCKRAELVIVPSVFLENIAIGWGVERENIKVMPEAIYYRALEISKEEARKKNKHFWQFINFCRGAYAMGGF